MVPRDEELDKLNKEKGRMDMPAEVRCEGAESAIDGNGSFRIHEEGQVARLYGRRLLGPKAQRHKTGWIWGDLRARSCLE